MGSKSKKHLHPVPVQAPNGNGGGKVGKVAVTPPSPPPQAHEVGTVVPVPAPEFDGLASGLSHINDLQRQLGAMTEDYEMRRGQILRALFDQRQAYSEQVKQMGVNLGLNLGPESNERWMFDPAQRSFTRQA